MWTEDVLCGGAEAGGGRTGPGCQLGAGLCAVGMGARGGAVSRLSASGRQAGPTSLSRILGLCSFGSSGKGTVCSPHPSAAAPFPALSPAALAPVPLPDDSPSVIRVSGRHWSLPAILPTRSILQYLTCVSLSCTDEAPHITGSIKTTASRPRNSIRSPSPGTLWALHILLSNLLLLWMPLSQPTAPRLPCHLVRVTSCPSRGRTACL